MKPERIQLTSTPPTLATRLIQGARRLMAWVRSIFTS